MPFFFRICGYGVNYATLWTKRIVLCVVKILRSIH